MQALVSDGYGIRAPGRINGVRAHGVTIGHTQRALQNYLQKRERQAEYPDAARSSARHR